MIQPTILPDGTPQWIKAPGARKDYSRDWADWLGTDTIASSSWSADDTGISVESSTHTDKTTTVWLSGGVVGKTYRVVNTIVTTGGRTEVKSIKINVKEQ